MTDIEMKLRNALATASTAPDEAFVQSVAAAVDRYERRRNWLTAALTMLAVVLAGGCVYGLMLVRGAWHVAAPIDVMPLVLGPFLVVMLMAAVAFAVAGGSSEIAAAGMTRDA